MSEPASLDVAVFAAQADLTGRGVLQPTALLLTGTGLGILPTRLPDGMRLPLGKLEGVPHCWREQVLHYGHFNGLPVWMIEDAPGEAREGDWAWFEAYPVWLAAAAGASTLVHTCAGYGLPGDPAAGGGDAPRLGDLVLASDHLNLSGATPLAGLAESRLGPMFPDQSLLHDGPLRETALELCERIGLSARAGVVACTVGPTIDTPAERRWFARAGAVVSVQRLGAPLIAAAHAGLGVLSICVVTAEGDKPVDIGRIAATSNAIAPAIDDLLWQLAAAVQKTQPGELERDQAW